MTLTSAYIIVAMEEGSVVQVRVYIHFVRSLLYFCGLQVKWDGKLEHEETLTWGELGSRVRRAVRVVACRDVHVALLQMN